VFVSTHWTTALTGQVVLDNSIIRLRVNQAFGIAHFVKATSTPVVFGWEGLASVLFPNHAAGWLFFVLIHVTFRLARRLI